MLHELRMSVDQLAIGTDGYEKKQVLTLVRPPANFSSHSNR